jgi:Na+/phosphate symporter
VNEVCCILSNITKIYNRTLVATFKENRKVLYEMVAESNKLFQQSRHRKYEILPKLKYFQTADINSGYFYVQIVDYLSEITKAILHITRPCLDHINNSHEGLNREQVANLMKINDAVEKIYIRINEMLSSKNFGELDSILEMRDSLFTVIADAIKDELKRMQANKSKTKTGMLYLTILNETKTLVLQSRNLLKSQKYFLEHSK